MPHNNASSPNTQALNNKNTKKFASHIGRGFYFSLPLATATLCWFNFNRSALAVNMDSQVRGKTTNSTEFSPAHHHESEHHQEHSGLFPRIFNSIASIFRSDIETLPEADLPAKEPQTIFNSEAMGGSFGRNLVPMYLSQADSLSSQKFSHKSKIGTVAAIDSIASPTKSNDELVYTVEPGDTITSIASKHKVSRQELIALNKINNSNVIFVNQKLRVPFHASDRVEVKAEKITLTKANFPQNSQQQAGISPQELQERRLANLRADINRMRSEIEREGTSENNNTFNGDNANLVSSADSQTDRGFDSISQESISLKLPPLPSSEEYLPEAFDGGYSWPAKGMLSSGYGWRWGRLHKGIDIAAPVGTPIFAAASGKVISAGWNSGGYGNLIKIKHLDGSVTLYAHNNRILVSKGQRVTRGEQIAEMGNTGFSTGSHLHFEIHSGNRGVINPLALLARR